MSIKFEEILRKVEAIGSPEPTLSPPIGSPERVSQAKLPAPKPDLWRREGDTARFVTRRDVPLITVLPIPATPVTDSFTANELLFGVDPTPGIVSVEFAPPNWVTLYIRDTEAASTSRYMETFRPFIWEANGSGSNLTPRYFDAWWRFRQARYDPPDRKRYSLNDPVQQYLTKTARTLFKGMRFEDLRRMQIDIETWSSPGRFSNPRCDRLLSIAMSDSSGWSEILVVTGPGLERAALAQMCALVQERDPDVIEGHNIFKFDLWYMATRARILGIKLPFGRGGQPLIELPWAGKLSLGNNQSLPFPNFRIHGRHIVDTYHLAELYDQQTRSLENKKLKYLAQVFDIADKNRVLLSGAEAIMWAYHNDREAFCRYTLGDVHETERVSAILSRSYFVQAQIFPYNYQDVITRGNATKTDALFLREYLRRGKSIPLPPPKRDFPGALCEALVTGVIDNVWHCDITSLYPSTILAFDCVPKSDNLGVFKAMVADLRDYRVRAKRGARAATDPLERYRLDTLQGTFKILVNSMYGYLGWPFGHFADFDAAERVTTIGRQILGGMRDWLMSQGCQVIEIDTDGIYFRPPDSVDGIEGIRTGLSAQLPPGIEVEIDLHYPAMFSYKVKNAAFLLEDGSVKIKGGALRSRGREPILSRYLKEIVCMLLEHQEAEARNLFDSYVEAIAGRTLPIEDLCKSHTLHIPFDKYRIAVGSGARNRDAAHELALSHSGRFAVGDRVSYYITPGKGPGFMRARLASEWSPLTRDEDVGHYLKRLEEVAKLFDEFAPGRISWRPERRNRKKQS